MKSMSLKFAACINTNHNQARRVVGYTASIGDLRVDNESKAGASTLLQCKMLDRMTYESARVRVVSYRGHVGIFSHTLDGGLRTQHAWPDGHVSEMLSNDPVEKAIDSFRYHVAQCEWDGTHTETPTELSEESMKEFRGWVRWQLAYRHASTVLGLNDVDSHRWACENERNTDLFLAAPSAA